MQQEAKSLDELFKRFEADVHHRVSWTNKLEKAVDCLFASRIELLFLGMQITEKDRFKSLLYMLIGVTIMVIYPTLWNTCSFFRRRTVAKCSKQYVSDAKRLFNLPKEQVEKIEAAVARLENKKA